MNMSRLWNRVVLILSAIGLFIAGTLAYADIVKKTVYCGADGGCAVVTQSPFSEFMGVKLSYIGVVAYLAMFALAIIRMRSKADVWQKLSVIGLVMSGLGFGFSIYLQIVSIVGIRELCYWCLGSAATMFLLFISHGLLAQAGAPVEEGDSKPEFAWVGGAVILALGLWGTQVALINQSSVEGVKADVQGSELKDALPIPAKVEGNSDAKVTVIEFADMNCPTCRVVYPEMKKLYQKYGGKLRLAFRHYPLFQLPGHETSTALAIVSERAADDGKFWAYLDKVMDPTNIARVKDVSGVVQIATEIGLNADEVRKIISDDAAMEPFLNRVNDDFTKAKDELRVEGTPAFIVFAEGYPPRSIGFDGLENALKEEPYASLLK